MYVDSTELGSDLGRRTARAAFMTRCCASPYPAFVTYSAWHSATCNRRNTISIDISGAEMVLPTSQSLFYKFKSWTIAIESWKVGKSTS